jgi:hypothetical protein
MYLILKRSICTVLAILLLVAGAPAGAQEEMDGPPGDIVEMWVVHASDPAAFEQAIKAHMPIRKANNDPFDWQVFTNGTGDELNTYYFRHCCFSWNDRDAYDAWEAASTAVEEDWGTNVDPHVASYEHHFEQIDFENSYWPDGSETIKFVGVTTYKIKADGWQAFNGAKDELSQIAINNGWASEGRRWAWVWSVDGRPTVSLAIPYENYADMTDPDPSFFEFLSGQIGAEEAAAKFGAFTAATEGSRYHVYTSRPDLSTPE